MALEPATSIAPVPPNLPFYDGRKLQGHFVGAYPQPVSGGGPPRRAGRLLMKQFVNAPAKDIPLATAASDLTEAHPNRVGGVAQNGTSKAASSRVEGELGTSMGLINMFAN